MIDATAAPSPAIARFGTEEPVAPPRILKAGVLEARLEAGNLRYIMIGGVEAIRGVAFLARDRNWGTYNARIEDLAVDERADGFTVSYRATVGDSAQSLSYTARIEGRADGSLTFTAEGAPDTDFVTNRTGFVVLHPLDGVIDHPVRIEHTDGSVEESRFPVEVNPACPFENIRAMTHEILPGVSLTCRMEGDAYEMEDHRNWLDASFKTYIRPLAKPWPYTMGEGEAFRQSVTITLEGKVPAATGGTGGPVTVTLGAATGTEVPRFGLAVPAAWTTSALERADLVAAAKPSFLVCHFDPRAGHDRSTIAEYAALGEAVGAPLVLEAVVPCEDASGNPTDDPAVLTRDIAGIAAAAMGFTFSHVAVSPGSDLKCTLPGTQFPPAPDWSRLVAETRRAFPGVPVGGGMFSYFTELNRKRPPKGTFDFVGHSGAPIVHAGDDESVMETLQSLPSVFHSVRAFAGATPYWIFPIAVSMRMNPYGAVPAENPDNIRQAMNRIDPRDRALLGAAWYAGTLAEAAKGGVDAVTMAAVAGPSGIVSAPGETARPWFDAARAEVMPSWHVVALAASLTGRAVLAAECDRPAAVKALAVEGEAGPVVVLINLTGKSVDVTLSGWSGANGWILDEESLADACAAAEPLPTHPQPTPLTLKPYAVARLTRA
ncbi:hypothetical protein [Acuticoccus sp. I52.16.1]|uniref:hypothetical protein n=1 Tax=Acuticoccus sp. I52.16.1 TaxID=2928472 RepID=UPI001FD51BF8|nr:hypothetical protein [Acuticoccus sp. I52.16.1]UOM34377.1 hypothetical protein MRB58_21565 [Acuticoccus sp. I52.16.1]